MTNGRGRPKKEQPVLTGDAATEMQKLENQLEEQKQHLKELAERPVNERKPVEETEPQTKLSQQQLRNSKDVWLKPEKSLNINVPFNEKFRDAYNYDKEYVRFIAEHKEIIGESIEIWTKKYPGVPAEFWVVPVNKPVWGPRYLAEQISKQSYTIYSMDDTQETTRDGLGTYYGHMVASKQVPRLTAEPVREISTVSFARSSKF